MKIWSRVLPLALAGLVVLTSLIACQNELSNEDIDRVADRVAEAPLNHETVNRMVDAFMNHPRYVEYLEDADGAAAEAMTNAMLEHPSFQATPEEDCAAVILMASVISGEYTLPPDSEVDRLCAWYLQQAQPE